MLLICKLISRLPSVVLYAMGGALGWVVYLLSPSYRRHFDGNWALFADWKTGQAMPTQQTRRPGVPLTLSTERQAAIREAGRQILELPRVWLRSPEENYRLIQKVKGWEQMERARANGDGVMLLTPHMGCFELIGVYVSAHMPMTCLFRPARQAFTRELMQSGRERSGIRLAPANLSGVRTLMRALNNREVIGILPDQTPQVGEGQWAAFFGRSAWSMTLAARLSAVSGVTTLLTWCERLPRGEGYCLHFIPLSPLKGSTPERVQQINAAVEQLVAEHPAQYLWGYNRYKRPRGAPPPPVS